MTSRKELLIALRHLLMTDFKSGFLRHVDTLLDERILMGKIRSNEYLNLRSLAYNTLADFLQYSISEGRLTIGQMGRTVCLYCRVLHDTGMNMPLVVETSSVKLMLNLVEPIYNYKGSEKTFCGAGFII